MEPTKEQQVFLEAKGKIVLCACPGSGKTTIVAKKFLTYKKGWDKAHSGIAVLSFTNVACDEIKNKIAEEEGDICFYEYPHFIGTVDSFIDNYIFLRFGYLLSKINARPKIQLKAASANAYRFWRRDCFQKDCISKIEQFRVLENRETYYKEEKVACEEKHGVIPCRSYIERMHRQSCYFQNEVPYQSLLLLKKHPDVVQAIIERFPVIIIDEAQDTSKDQMAIFDLLVNAGLQEAILVGDPDQSIYEWRTAKRECFVKKINDPNWLTLYLTNNFRSSQLICNVTKAFSETYHNKPANKSIGEHAKFHVKPILLFYDLKSQQEEIISYFKAACETNNIELNRSAVVSRGRISSKNHVENLWKNFQTEQIAEAAYNFLFGSRRLAFELLEKAIFSLTVKDLEDIDISLEREVEKYVSYSDWKYSILQLLTSLPLATQELAVWVAEAQSCLCDFSKKNQILKNLPKALNYKIIQIKQRDKTLPNFNHEKLSSYFGNKEMRNNFTLSTIHGVKGESYDALMLVVENTRGATLTPKFLAEGNLDDEKMRIAYVAMTRPKKLLVVAMPRISNFNEKRFSRSDWNYIYL